MVRKTSVNTLAAGLLVAGTLSDLNAEPLLLHREPIDPHGIKASFRVNPARGLVGVRILIDRSGFTQIEPRPTEIVKSVDGLVYDAASNEIRYQDVVCAKFLKRSFLITHWYALEETGACRFINKLTTVTKDNGIDDEHHYSVTEVYLDNA